MEEGQNNFDPASDSVPVTEACQFIFNKIPDGKYKITDDNNKIIFYVERFDTRFEPQQFVLLDRNNFFISKLRKQVWSDRWNAYSYGENSPHNSDLLFSIEKKSKTVLVGSLANKQSSCDSKIKGCMDMMKKRESSKFKATIYPPNVDCARICMGPNIMAQMKRMEGFKDKFTVTIYPPNLDRATVISLISVFVIIEAMNGSSSLDNKNRHHNQHNVGDVAHAASRVAQGVSRVAEAFSDFAQGVLAVTGH